MHNQSINAMKNIKEIKQKLIERDGLRCSVSGDIVNCPEELSVDHIIPKSKGGGDDLDNLILVRCNMNALIADDEKKRTLILVEELRKRQEDLTSRERENFKREQDYRIQIEQQKQQLEEFRFQLKKEQAEREAIFEREIQDQRQRVMEQQQMLAIREHEAEEIKSRLSQELQEKERRISLAFEELEREKEKYRDESRKKIESRSSAYVNDALTALDAAATKYHFAGRNWSIAGSLALVAGVGTGLYFGVKGGSALGGQTVVTWPQLFFFAFKGIIVAGLFVALAKYCFSYGQSFTHEAIKNSERKHAINFGKFYLETYGADAQWVQIKEAFEHWNINSTSAFLGNDPDKFDPKVFEKAIKLVETVQNVGKRKQDEKENSSKA
jgi:hypothetical protein